MLRLFISGILLLLCMLNAVHARKGYGPGEQDWGFVDVRKGAHMFYWLYYTTANVNSYTERPLVIWLQGGPGASSTGYGNFEELGPLTLKGNYRETTWVKEMNVLFIDNPVGSGFSYVENDQYYTKNNKEIAIDLVAFMKAFYKLHPEFESVPLHIFCQSYGGKMAPEFALELYYAIERGELKSNLTSVALGNPWTSPIDSVLSYAPFLLQLGVVEQQGYAEINAEALKLQELIKNEKWADATTQWSDIKDLIWDETHRIDFYNVQKPTIWHADFENKNISAVDLIERIKELSKTAENRDRLLLDLMRTNVTVALNITTGLKWGAQKRKTFSYLNVDFMKPAVDIVSELLNKTSIKVGVYSGQLDLICATPGTVKWIEDMQWNDKTAYAAAPRRGIVVNNTLEGYQKSAGNFKMFWINRSGHDVPKDNPAAMSYILRAFTNYG